MPMRKKLRAVLIRRVPALLPALLLSGLALLLTGCSEDRSGHAEGSHEQLAADPSIPSESPLADGSELGSGAPAHQNYTNEKVDGDIYEDDPGQSSIPSVEERIGELDVEDPAPDIAEHARTAGIVLTGNPETDKAALVEKLEALSAEHRRSYEEYQKLAAKRTPPDEAETSRLERQQESLRARMHACHEILNHLKAQKEAQGTDG